jgi:Tol biopolymer transport system component
MRALLLSVAVLVLITANTAAPAPQPMGNTIGWISWAPGPTILFEAYNIYSVRGDGTGLRKLPPLGHPVWAPGGTQIAGDVGDPPGSIFVMNADGSGSHRVRAGGMYPVWSPSGDRIAATTWYRILVMNADGRSLRKVAALPFGQDPRRELDWSPDGSRVVFSQCLRSVPDGDFCEGRRAGVFTVSADRQLGPKRRVLSGTDCPDWAPAGRIVVGSHGGAIRTVAPNGSRFRVAIARPFNCGSWSPDGRLVAAETYSGLVLAKADGSARWRLHKLPPGDADIEGPPAPVWSPDGKWIAVARLVQNSAYKISSRIYVINVRDGRARLILRTPYR